MYIIYSPSSIYMPGLCRNSPVGTCLNGQKQTEDCCISSCVMAALVLSLQKQCMLYVACHLEQFPPDMLAMLPPPILTELVRSVTVADVCMLERTPVASRVDFDSIWSKISMNHPVPQSFPDEHFNAMLGYESTKDYFFTFVWHLALTEQVPVVHRIRTRTQALHNWQNAQTRGMLLDSGSSVEGFQAFCSIMISLQSAADIEDYNSVFQCLLKLPSVLREPYIPQRFKRFLREPLRRTKTSPGAQRHRATMTLTGRASLCSVFQSMAMVLLRTCNYRPRAVQIKTRDFLRSKVWRDSTIEAVASIFRNVRYMCIVVQAEFNQDQVADCNNLIKGIFPTALWSLQKLRIKFENATALNLFLPRIYSVIMNSSYNEITSLRSLALCIDRLTEQEIMASKSENTLFMFTKLFETAHFESLILEGMWFRDEVMVPKIITTFLSAHCTGKQRLVLSRIQFDYCGLTVFPSFKLPECAGQHKELKFNAMTLKPRILERLFVKPQFRLRSLEVLLENWHHNVPPDGVWSTNSMHNKLILDLCATNDSLEIPCLCFHIHLVSSPSMKGMFEALLSKRTLEELDLSCCNIGPGGVTTALTHGLLAHTSVQMGSLRVLNLSKNGIGLAEDKRVYGFFVALFSLPKLPRMHIDLSHNNFTSQHFEMMHRAWSDTTELQVKFLSFARNYYASSTLIRDLALKYDISNILFK